jgi:hypothetical protein
MKRGHKVRVPSDVFVYQSTNPVLVVLSWLLL